MAQARHIFLRGLVWHYRRRVPTALRAIVGREHIGRSLETEDEAVALAKSREIDRTLDAEWRDLNAVKTANAYKRHDAVKRIAESQGFTYLSGVDLAATATNDDILRRLAYLEAVTPPGQKTDEAIESAILGLSDPPTLKVSSLCEAYFALTPDLILGKNDRQKQVWTNTRTKIAREFLNVVGDKPLGHLTKSDYVKFREFQWSRVMQKEIIIDTANKRMQTLMAMLREIAQKHELDLPKVEGLRFRAADTQKKPPLIPIETIITLLKPETLETLNPEARRMMIMYLYTGARCSEISGLNPDDIRLDHDIPHILIRPNENRKLKNRHSERQMPLVSGALMAMQAQPEGFPRYRRSPDPAATIRKYLRQNDLVPRGVTPHSARHTFSDMLLDLTGDERLRCELMGHNYKAQQSYGKGFSLAAKRDILLRLPLPTPERV